MQVPHLTRAAKLRSHRTPSSPVPGEEKVSVSADGCQFIPGPVPTGTAYYPRLLSVAGIRRDILLKTWQCNKVKSLHVILTLMEANMTDARMEMLGLWMFLMMLIIASHLYT